MCPPAPTPQHRRRGDAGDRGEGGQQPAEPSCQKPPRADTTTAGLLKCRPGDSSRNSEFYDA